MIALAQRSSVQVFYRRVALVGSWLLKHNLTDAGSVWDNTEQLIVQLQVICKAFVLRQFIRRRRRNCWEKPAIWHSVGGNYFQLECKPAMLVNSPPL